MTAHATIPHRRFTRNADKACLGGVCAGIADYFGFNLRVTRLLVIIAFFVATPVTVLVYIAIVLLVPSESSRFTYGIEPQVRRRRRRMSRAEKKQAAEEARQQAADAIKERARSLDERLARVEKYVTSSRYNLDREFRNL
jgi:phage shock protein C